MKELFASKMLAAGVGLAVLEACGGSGGGVPSSVSGSQPASSSITDNARALRLSGQYAGTVKDNERGSGKFNLSLSQYKSSLGGVITGSPSNALVGEISWSVRGTSVNGDGVNVSGSTYCTFAHTATYDTKRSVLSGSYKAVYGCTGETGTYRFKQQCYYKGTTGADVWEPNGPRSC